MTKLEAINEILDTIGETPVSSLSTALPDAKTAVRILDRVTKRVLSTGYHCNTEYDYPMPRDEDNRIPVPPNILRIDTYGRDFHRDATIRVLNSVRYLYDVDNHSFTFDRTLRCVVVWNIPFEALTYGLQLYIACLAAREFQISELGSVAYDGLIGRTLAEAKAAMEDEEAENEDNNILTDCPSVAWTTYRNSRIRWR